MAKHTDIEIIAPRANPFLAGHAEAEQRFVQEFAGGKMHHAYLMTGPKGIGKATLAYRFARHVLGHGAIKSGDWGLGIGDSQEASFSLFGEPEPAPIPSPIPNPQSLNMSPEEPLFRRIASASHSDLLTLSPAYDAKKHVEKNIITVDEARKVPDFLSLTPAEGDWRVVIVDAVDQLNPNAANALLKIIEEPPARALLFLICHQPGSILPTIRSRCRQFKLAAPSITEFGEILNHIAPSIPSHEYASLYALSHGSPGHAITLYVEEGLRWYEGWLAAMQPDAPLSVRQSFADSAAAQKSPAAWDAIMHGWNMAMERLTLHPHYATEQTIFRQEEELLDNLAAATPPNLRRTWAARGQQLIHETETYNLDKRYTLRLLTDVAQLAVMAD